MNFQANIQPWYQELTKPFFAPEPWVFGVAWGIIYPMMALAFAWIVYLVVRKELSAWILLPVAINVIFNVSFTYIQFGLQNNPLAFVWIAIVLASLLWILVMIYPLARIPFWLLVPYALWGSFATLLQASITYLNR